MTQHSGPLARASLVWLLLPALYVAGQDAPPARVARLIRDLAADSYQVREAAGDELGRLGRASREQLAVAARSTDPEVRLRAADLLRRLHIDAMWQASRVSLDCQNQKLSQAIEAIGRQCPNHVRPGTRFEPCNDATLTVSFDNAGYWQTLDALCRQTGNRLRPHYDARERGVVVAAGSLGEHPIAYAGPIRLEIVSARRVYDDELLYKNFELKRQHTFKLVLSAMWEDRLQLVAYAAQPKVLAARTDSGEELFAVEANHAWNIIGTDTQQLSFDLKLQPPSPRAERIESLLVSWNLIAIGDRAEIELSLDNREIHRQDGREFSIESSQPKSETLHEVVLLSAADEVLPEPIEAVFQESRHELVDAEGRAWRLIDQHHELEGDAIKSRLTFRRDTAKPSTPSMLRVNYPRVRSQRAVEAMFRDVPLPKNLAQ